MLAFFILLVLTIASALTTLALIPSNVPFIGIVLFGALTVLLACVALIAFMDMIHGEKSNG